MASPRAAGIQSRPPAQPTLEKLRARHGTGTDDDLLILKTLIPERDIAAMRAAGPIRRDYPLASAEMEEIRALITTVRASYLHVASERWELELRRS
jgi:oxaloacetate decarboxylase alpha subunit